MMRFLIAALLFSANLFAEVSKSPKSEYEFVGVHLVASYNDCDEEALCNVERLKEVMEEAARASGATILDSADYLFPPHGLTMVLLLSESHASIHTYPEYKACFIDLFTCGHNCSAERFDEVLRSYLKPKKAHVQKLLRDDKVKLLPNH